MAVKVLETSKPSEQFVSSELFVSCESPAFYVL